MDTAKMSHTSDDANSSDDLIAELARLMAQDAKGDSATDPAPAVAPARNPEPHSVPAANPEGLSRPRTTNFQSPTPRFRTPQTSDYSASPSARLDASGGSDALYEVGERGDGERSSLKLEPTFGRASSRASLLSDMLSEEEEQLLRDAAEDKDPVPQFGRTKAMQFSTREREQDRDQFDADLFRREEVAEPEAPAEVGGAYTPTDQSEQRAAPERQSRQEDEDPIGQLIAAQLDDTYPETGSAADESLAGATNGEEAFVSFPDEAAREENFAPSPAFDTDVQPVSGVEADDAHDEMSARDPLADIENLIGEAVRSGVSNHAANADFEDARYEPDFSADYDTENRDSGNSDEDRGDVNGAAMAAEAAILAATASTQDGRGAKIDQVYAREAGSRTASDGVQEMGGADSPAQRAGSWRRYAGPVVAAGLLVAAGLGLYWVFGNVPLDEGEAPVLTADTAPVKAEPEASEPAENSASRSIVFDEASGNSDAAASEQLVSRDQTGGASGSEVSRLITGDDAAESGLANRKVRTVTVRPDGTIVSGEETLAGGELLPVDRPNVPELPEGAQTAASEFAGEPVLTEGTAAQGATDAAGETEEASAETGAETSVTPPMPRPRIANRNSTPTSAGARSASGVLAAPSDGGAVDLIAATANQAVSQPAALATPTLNTPAATTTGSSAPAYVQLSSQRSEAAAQQSLGNLQSRFGSLFASSALEVQQVDLGERGIFYRVRLPATSLESANSICSNVKANGGDCFVRTN